ncbi:LysR substrate-binding domain-containing protein (plasmid) [Rhizobium rhododendri]|uniref:LysR substrate-binding domain-containing protein n=2 Tax=Rhizobium rhododendri TaxID=2506430 RepID=A0ABY8ISY0_9HYPH|nr:LysR substrate-binding domain-containing protein [Rhizobium rhododendri]WFS26095.1 LysR substrate-binding domain-containing protein [Rhizobium rhododendri]
MSGSIRIAAPTTFGRLHILPTIPNLLAEYPHLRGDLVLSQLRRDMIDDRVDLVIRGVVEEPDAVARRVTNLSLVCVGSRQYLEKHGVPTLAGSNPRIDARTTRLSADFSARPSS